MRFQIRFDSAAGERETPSHPPAQPAAPRPSVVQVHFPSRSMTLAYYNELFDLQVGDRVFVDGKLAGHPGRVVEVSYNFKIRIADYHRVIALADTAVRGRFHLAGSHLAAFDRETLPPRKARSWFLPPEEDGGYLSGSDERTVPLEELLAEASSAAAERGQRYYLENRVRYLCLDGAAGYAIVEGSKPYEVEFSYQDGGIRRLTCSCYGSGCCRHCFAAMLQLRETLERVETDYAGQYHGYLAAVERETLLSRAANDRARGVLSLA